VGDLAGAPPGPAPFRAAVIGTGFGTRVHVPGLRLAGVEVVAIASRRAARAAAAAAALGIPAAFDDYRTMLATAQPDLVCVVTPPALHPEMVRAAVAGGAHVICEKPLAYDAARAWEMATLAARSGLVNATNFQFRYWPARVRFRELVRAGTIGELRLLRYVWTAPLRLDPAAPAHDWFARRETGGGVLYNLGAHFFDFVRWCFGEVRAATGALEAFVPRRALPDGSGTAPVTADDTASVELVLESGALVSCQLGFVTAGRRIAIEAYGADGTLVLEDDRVLLAGRRPDAPLEAVPVAPLEPAEPKPLAPFVLLARDVVARATGGVPPLTGVDLPTFADGARTQAVIDAVRGAAAGRRWLDVAREAPGGSEVRGG